MSARATAAASRLATGAAVVVGAMLLAGPAYAAPVTRDNSTESYDFTVWDCGYPIAVHGDATSNQRLRVDKNGLEHWSITWHTLETWSVPDGRFVTIAGNYTRNDLPYRATDSGPMFHLQIAGQPVTVRDSNGAVLSRDSGNLRWAVQVDPQTGNWNFLDTKVAGPHPSFGADLCAIFANQLGNGSGARQVERPLGSTPAGMGYDEYLPPSYSSDGAASPLIVAANGYGESGDGTPGAIANLVGNGIPRFIHVGGWPLDRPFVVLSTQHVVFSPSPTDGAVCPDYRYASCYMQYQHDIGNPPGSVCTTPSELHDFITYALGAYNVDPHRVYLTGLSCGGYGVWEYLAAFGNQQIAAAVPIAGEGRPAWDTAGCALTAVPTWAFHGELDDVVDPAGSIVPMTHLLQDCGANPDDFKLTVYPGLYHDGWDQAYSGSLGDDIYTWMLAHTKA